MEFIDNKFTKTYWKIIKRSKNRPLVSPKEKHHAIPKSMGGSNEASNIANLTPKEHFICHLLLCKMTEGKYKKSAVAALLYMQGIAYRKPGLKYHLRKTAKLYQSFREIMRKDFSGPGNPMWGKKQSKKNKEAVRKAQTGKFVSKETRERMSTAFKKRKLTEKTKKKISRIKKKLWSKLSVNERKENIKKRGLTHKGIPQSDYQKQRARETMQKTWKVTDIGNNKQSQIIVNLRKFCLENNLDQGNMVKVSQGKLKQHKGWKCELIST